MIYKDKKRLQIALRRLYTTKAPSKEILPLVGIDKAGFINHINKFLLSGMTETNFGVEWGLDHIVPAHIFDSTNITDLALCYNYNNIMPMWNSDNRLKGASVHFSLTKLDSMETNEHIQKLKNKCYSEINRVYQKYLLTSY